MRELELCVHLLRDMDQGEFTLLFFAHPEHHHETVSQVLMDSVLRTYMSAGLQQEQLQNRFDQAASRLTSEFFAHTWPTHDCHFHKSFKEYCNCPFTCLTELVDCIDKIART